MSSTFCRDMDNNYQGDLSDIIRASAGASCGGGTSTTSGGGIGGGGFGSSNSIANNNTISNYSEYQNSQLKGFYQHFSGDIGTILSNCLDTDVIPISTTLHGGGGGGDGDGGRLTYVVGPPSSIMSNNLCKTPENISCTNVGSSSMVQILQDNNNKTSNINCSISYSNNKNMRLPLLGAAAAASTKVGKAGFGFLSNNNMFSNNNNNSNNPSCSSTKSGFVDGPTTGVQIPSPRNQVGIKRRKIQAKKVVCIPALAAANSRQTGEVVPSDLWAWRKYGQKPIKGSPYPRGYYRCSSSKGCSARKQVERSRTDPNMLVITYTSEHNHPWPTQRNALAGSTRSSSQPSKTSSKPSSSSSPKKSSSSNNKSPLVKEENSNQSASISSIKDDNRVQEGLIPSCENDCLNNELFNDSYRPLIVAEPNINGHQEVADQDFFADLVEFESDDDLLKLFSSQQGCKQLDDPFSGAFQWATNNANISATTNEDNNDHTTLSPTSKIS